MRTIRFAAVLAAATLLSSLTANAATFYDNGVTPTSGVDAQFGTQIVADDFTVPLGITSVTGISWGGLYVDNTAPLSDTFSVRIFSDNGGVPSFTPSFTETLAVSRTDTGTDLVGRDYYEYNATLSSAFALVPGGTYWLSVYNESKSDWYWGIDAGGNSYFSDPVGDGIVKWTSQGVAMDFALSSMPPAVPLPAGLPLLGAGLAGFAFLRRRAS